LPAAIAKHGAEPRRMAGTGRSTQEEKKKGRMKKRKA
jgi:hypothetical protein